MKYLDEYRDGATAARLATAIAAAATRRWTIMEICGGQTHSILRYGVDRLLPESTGRTPSRPETASRSVPSATCCECPARRAICWR